MPDKWDSYVQSASGDPTLDAQLNSNITGTDKSASDKWDKYAVGGAGGAINKPPPEPPITKDDIINFARPLATDAAVAAGTALAPEIGIPAGLAAGGAGLLTGGLVDRLMQHVQSQPPQDIISKSLNLQPGSFASDTANTAEQMLGGKLFEGLTKPIVRPIANAFNSSNIIDPELQKLGATFSQYQDPNSYLGRMAKFVEDTFARGSKSKAITNSAEVGFNQAKSVAADLSGRSINTVQSPEIHGQLLQQEAIANQSELKDAFNQFATKQQMYKPQYIAGQQTNLNYNPVKYAEATQNAAAVAKLHASLFEERGLSGLVNDPDNTAVPFINQILEDPQKLGRALKSSSLPIPGTNNITSPALRGDLQGYYLNKVIDGASQRDPISGRISSIDPQKVIDQFADPSMTDSVKQLYSQQQRSDISQLFKNLAMTQQKMNAGFSTNSKIFWTAEALSLAPSILEGGVKWGYPAGVAAIRLGGSGLAHMMTDPKIARTMVAAASGSPLGTSGSTIARGLADALNGVKVTLVGKDNRNINGTIKDGQFEPSSSATVQ